MNAQNENRLKKMLRAALPPVKSDAGPERDLWPEVRRRIGASEAATIVSGWAWLNGGWFDGALLAGVVGMAAIFPTAIPVFLYYL